MKRMNHDSSLADQIDVREAEIIKIAESKQDVAELLKHLSEIVESKSFRGSHRSGQFLIYIVERAIAGQFDALKERIIGIELFGRSPTYDTGDDAIVRVTASDVRRRLLQYYGENGRSSKFFISLPSGSYVPEIVHGSQTEAKTVATSGAHQEPTAALDHSAVAIADLIPALNEPTSRSSDTVPDSGFEALRGPNRRWRLWLSFGILFLAINLGMWLFSLSRSQRPEAPPISALPWSTFFYSSHATHLITSDPNIVHIQEITDTEISVSDYANRQYIPEPNKLSAEALKLSRIFLLGDNSASAVDTPIALRILGLAQIASKKIDAHAARSIQLSDLKSDDNFIFLGSPRSNPWSGLFSDQLDFRFVFDKGTGHETIANAHPRPGELPAYIPTAQGWATGQSFAIIAFVQNPDQNGQVLLLSGADGEGTEAAGKFVTDLPRLSAALDRCGIQSKGPLQHFELLLGLKTMAGSPTNVDVVACHILPGQKNH
jgi:hypothetical protein